MPAENNNRNYVGFLKVQSSFKLSNGFEFKVQFDETGEETAWSVIVIAPLDFAPSGCISLKVTRPSGPNNGLASDPSCGISPVELHGTNDDEDLQHRVERAKGNLVKVSFDIYDDSLARQLDAIACSMHLAAPHNIQLSKQMRQTSTSLVA